MNIRIADPSDIPSIAQVHVATWLSAYRGIIPDTHLEKLTHDRRFNFWLDAIGDPTSSAFVYVAEDTVGRVVGFAASGPSRASHFPYDSELYAIYVLPDQQGNGAGRQLVSAIGHELRARGVRSMILYVLKDNPARHFYEDLGGQLLEERQVDIGGAIVADVIYGWPDITPLIKQHP